MTEPEEVWIPLVDEPIGTIVAQMQADHADIDALIDTPQRLLAFKTFAYIRVGLLLGELLLENDIEPYNGSDTWIDQLLGNPEFKARIVNEVREVAREVARDTPAEEAPVGPDDAARDRFREYARRRLEAK